MKKSFPRGFNASHLLIAAGKIAARRVRAWLILDKPTDVAAGEPSGIAPQLDSSSPVSSRASFGHALRAAADALNHAKRQDCEIYTSNEQFNDWPNRSIADLHCMITNSPHGPYPYAGVPWFSTAFGRDGIITALECLWINSEIARGVLQYLAEVQAREVIPEQDAEPGKILHETRLGELAALGEIPFR